MLVSRMGRLSVCLVVMLSNSRFILPFDIHIQPASRLDVAEGEGDLLKAIMAGNIAKIRKEYTKLLAARVHLAQI